MIRKELEMHPYPTLALIDSALGAAGPGFASADNAAALEAEARALADEYWSETVWLTGRITEAAFCRVYEPLMLRWLTTERATRQDATVSPQTELIVVTVGNQLLAPTSATPSPL